MILTSFAASLAVNALVTGLIVFKILRVFLEVRGLRTLPQAGELTLGSLSSTGGGKKLRQILFIIIESGVVLFVAQLLRIVIVNLETSKQQQAAINFILPINQMLNVNIIRSVHYYFFCFTDNILSG